MRAIAWSTAAAAALVVLYLALGGASYAPAEVADPCAARGWGNRQGFQEVAEKIVLSAIDSAACKLGVSREKIVLALANRDSFRRFVREEGVSADELEELVRDGLVQGVDEAERADALDPLVADLLRGVARRLPVDQLLDLLEELDLR